MHSIGRIRVSLRLQKNFTRNLDYTSIIYRVLGILLGSDYKSNANELTWISQFKKRKEKWWWISLWLSLGQMFIWWFYRSKWVGPTWAGLLRKGQDGEIQETKISFFISVILVGSFQTQKDDRNCWLLESHESDSGPWTISKKSSRSKLGRYGFTMHLSYEIICWRTKS